MGLDSAPLTEPHPQPLTLLFIVAKSLLALVCPGTSSHQRNGTEESDGEDKMFLLIKDIQRTKDTPGERCTLSCSNIDSTYEDDV